MSYGDRESGRRYSGYDEYEGIFGSLGATGSRSASRSLGAKYALSTTSGSAIGSSGRGFPSRRSNPTSALSSNGYERRQRYLAERTAKRRMKPFDLDQADDDDDDDGAPGDGHTASAMAKQPQQIWLPTKNFTFRQRAGKLDTRTLARLDLQKIVATTDVAAIQKHLDNVAFSDVTLDDVQHYSDAYFLKLFQIAQLTLEYLLNVQDSLASHCENLETQCEGLAEECSTLESENQKIDSEVVSLKKEIRQKQSTLATFEMMLLNATASKRASQLQAKLTANSQLGQENDPAVLNILGEEQVENGAVPLVSACVVCGKNFISPEYLVRHQLKKHRDHAQENRSIKTKKKPKKKHDVSSSSSSSRSGSESERKTSKKKISPVPMEVMQVLSQSNEVTKQLMELQFQLRSEKEKRAEEAKLHDQQQALFASQLTNYMSKLQETLVEMEKKQEQSKHEMMRYTQESLDRLEKERKGKAHQSHAGKLESDDDDRESTTVKRAKPLDPPPPEQRMLDSLLRTQAEIQHKNSELEQTNRKLQSKLKRRVRSYTVDTPMTTLMSMAALDARRFGMDAGMVDLDNAKSPPVAKAPVIVEDKLVQTDEERDAPRKATKKAAMQSQLIQTDAIAAAPVIAPALAPLPEPTKVLLPPLRKAESKIPKPTPAPIAVKKEIPVPVAVPAPVAEPKSKPAEPSPVVGGKKTETKLQHAAHVVGKVALGFLTRKALQNPSNWLLTLPAASLIHTLSEHEILSLSHCQARDEHQGEAKDGPNNTLHDITIEIEDHMTANDLRVAFAEALSGPLDAHQDPPIDYHRILLHHRHTGQELHGDQFIYHLRNQIDVEIIPFFDAAEAHVDSVLDFHGQVSTQLQVIRRASLEFQPGELLGHDGGGESLPRTLEAVVRIQSIVRGFLAKRCVEMMRIDKLVEARLISMAAQSPSAVQARARSQSQSQSQRRMTAAVTRSVSMRAIQAERTDDRVVTDKAQQIHGKLADLVRLKTGVDTRTKSAKWSKGQLSTKDYDFHCEQLQQTQQELPEDVQRRIRHISERIEKLVEDEYDPVVGKKQEDEYHAASRIQLAVQVAIARKKLNVLLGKKETTSLVEKDAASRVEMESDSEQEDEKDDKPQKGEVKKEEDEEDEDKALDVEELDDTEIKRLADAYERDGDKNAETKTVHEKPAAMTSASLPTAKSEEKKQPPRPGTPPPPRDPPPQQPDLAGRSPRPQAEATHVISPFSKTPLLSRRAPVTRRGSGYDNAR